MKLTILGSGTLVPVSNRSNPAYFLDIGDDTILLDSGSGTLRQIAKAGRSIWEIDKIFYSHLHIDHTIEIIPLLFSYKYSNDEPYEVHKIDIYAHQNFMNYFNDLKEIFSKWIDSQKYEYRIKHLEENSYSFDDFKLEVFTAEHMEESLIYRFTDKKGKSFVYSGDTDICQGIIEASKDTDLLLIECSFPDGKDVKGHMSPKKISKLITESNPKRVILTHIYPESDSTNIIDQIDNTTGIPISIASDLQVIEI